MVVCNNSSFTVWEYITYILNLDVENEQQRGVRRIEHHRRNSYPTAQHKRKQFRRCRHHPRAGQSHCNSHVTQLVLDPLDIELEEKKVTDVLHRSKEQKYAFDKIYRNHTSELVFLLSFRFTLKLSKAL